MLPVSQAVQASKPTQAHASAGSEAHTDQGFAALFAQGLGAPDAGAVASAEGTAIQRSPGASTAPAGGDIRRSSGETTATQGREAEPPAPGATGTPAAEAPADSSAAGSRATRAHRDEPPADPANALLVGLQGAQQIPLAAPQPGDATRGPASGSNARAGAARLGVADAPMVGAATDEGGAGATAAGTLDFQSGLSGAAAARTDARSEPAAPGGEPGKGLSAGLSALLARQGSDPLSSAAWTGSTSSHASTSSGSPAGSDGGLLYSQVAQSLLQSPGLDAAAAAAVSPTLPLAPPVGDERWSAALGQQALFMTRNQLSSAQLTVNPPNLGPIQITLDLKHDQATAVFVSPHDAVRQAIEASLPQLRDMFSAAGLHLGSAQVQSDGAGSPGQSPGGQSAFAEARAGGEPAGGTRGTVAVGATSARPLRASQGLLDTFA